MLFHEICKIPPYIETCINMYAIAILLGLSKNVLAPVLDPPEKHYFWKQLLQRSHNIGSGKRKALTKESIYQLKIIDFVNFIINGLSTA